MKFSCNNLFILFIQIQSIAKQIDELDVVICQLKDLVSSGNLLNEQQIVNLCNHEINRAGLYRDLQRLRLGKYGHFVKRILIYLIFNIQNASIVIVNKVLLVLKVLLVKVELFLVVVFLSQLVHQSSFFLGSHLFCQTLCVHLTFIY